MRIISLLPSATEMICALGLRDSLVGRTHECDFPSDVERVPVVSTSLVDSPGLSSREIDDAVARAIREGRSIYVIDDAKLREAAPDLILTQSLCDVCAPTGNDLTQAVARLPRRPEILTLTPTNLEGIFQNIIEVGRAAGRVGAGLAPARAEALVAQLRSRVDAVSAKIREAGRPEGRPLRPTRPGSFPGRTYAVRTTRPGSFPGSSYGVRRRKVWCAEWLEPPYAAGHWIPELVRLAGGREVVGAEGVDSRRVTWDEIVAAAPEVVVLMPCGWTTEQVVERFEKERGAGRWTELPAWRTGSVWAANATAYFSRPGPRIVEGLGTLAKIIHPELFGSPEPRAAVRLTERRADLKVGPYVGTV